MGTTITVTHKEPKISISMENGETWTVLELSPQEARDLISSISSHLVSLNLTQEIQENYAQ